MQIGGGVRVGDAFQAIVEFNLIAIGGMWFCVEISQAGHSCPARLTREIRAVLPTGAGGGATGRAKAVWRLNGLELRALATEFETCVE